MKAVSDVAARHSPDWHTLTHQQSSAFELLHPLLHCSLCSPQLVALEGKDSHHWMSPSTFLPRSHCTPYPFWVILPLYKDPGTFLHSWEAIQPIQKQGCRTKIKCLCLFLYYSIAIAGRGCPNTPAWLGQTGIRRKSKQKSAETSYFSTLPETLLCFSFHSPLFLSLEMLSLPSRRRRNIWPWPWSLNPKAHPPPQGSKT